MINGPGKYSVNIATPGVTIRGTDGARPVRCMMALAEQISELDSIVIYGRVVGVRGLVMERAMPSGRYPAVNVPQPVSRTMPACGRSGLSPSAHASAPGHGDLCGHGGAFGSEPIVPGPAPRSTRLSGCTSRSKLFLPKVRKKQPAWRKDTVGWPKSWPPRKPNANVIAP